MKPLVFFLVLLLAACEMRVSSRPAEKLAPKEEPAASLIAGMAPETVAERVALCEKLRLTPYAIYDKKTQNDRGYGGYLIEVQCIPKRECE